MAPLTCAFPSLSHHTAHRHRLKLVHRNNARLTRLAPHSRACLPLQHRISLAYQHHYQFYPAPDQLTRSSRANPIALSPVMAPVTPGDSDCCRWDFSQCTGNRTDTLDGLKGLKWIRRVESLESCKMQDYVTRARSLKTANAILASVLGYNAPFDHILCFHLMSLG